MPDGLLRTPVPPIHHASRTLLLPLSIGAHALLFATCFVVTVMADVTLPTPAPRRALYEPAPAIPVVVEQRPSQARHSANDTPTLSPPSGAAPTEAPDHIVDRASSAGEPGEQDMVRQSGVTDGWPIATSSTVVEAPPPAPPHGPVRPGGDIAAPRKTHDVVPIYPPIAQSARVEGTVILEVIIDRDGRVRQAHVLRSVPLLDRAAVSAVEQWVFTPTRLNGEAVPVVMTVTVDFRLR